MNVFVMWPFLGLNFPSQLTTFTVSSFIRQLTCLLEVIHLSIDKFIRSSFVNWQNWEKENYQVFICQLTKQKESCLFVNWHTQLYCCCYQLTKEECQAAQHSKCTKTQTMSTDNQPFCPLTSPLSILCRAYPLMWQPPRNCHYQHPCPHSSITLRHCESHLLGLVPLHLMHHSSLMSMLRGSLPTWS